MSSIYNTILVQICRLQQVSFSAFVCSFGCVFWDRKLGMAGQKLGASALLCYIHHEPSDPGGNFSLTVANVGTCQAVLCRDGRPVALSKVYSLENCTEEMERVKLCKAIITEVMHWFTMLGFCF